jgi:hypothetical protein
MNYEYKYVICVLEESNASLKQLEKLLAEGWEPVRETGMPSSGSNYSENAQLPTCLCVLRKPLTSVE